MFNFRILNFQNCYATSRTSTNRLLLAVSQEYKDSGITKKKDVKETPAKMLPPTLSKHCMYTISIFAVRLKLLNTYCKIILLPFL